MSLYEHVRQLGIPFKSDGCDLLIPANKQNLALIRHHQDCFNVVRNDKSEEWYVIQFAYLPFWQNRDYYQRDYMEKQGIKVPAKF